MTNKVKKRRILFSTEASYTLSGFGKYTMELMKRLHASGKYEIAEFSSYALVNHPKDSVPWRVYANAVKNDDPRFQQYRSNPVNQFGAWRLERVLLDFKCDILFGIRDPWMLMHEHQSPYRPFFHWIISPTVDSQPSNMDWIQPFMDADCVLTYSDWGADVLRKDGGGKIKVSMAASPGTDMEIFKPVQNLQEHRKMLGLPPNANILGTVMRNQKRKLYPDLFIAFRKFLDICEERGNRELSQKTFLYCHTSYPDVGWNIPQLLKENQISHKVFFTYMCQQCNRPFCSLFQDARTFCPHCKSVSAITPSVAHGLTEKDLACIYQAMDLYIQYAICLGKDEEILIKENHPLMCPTKWKKISEVKIGDLAWTHKHRWQKVTNTFKNLNNKLLKKVTVCGDYESVIATENHEFYSITHKDLQPFLYKRIREGVRGHIGRLLKNNKTIPLSTPKPLCNLQIGDMLAYPIDDNIIDIDKINISNYALGIKEFGSKMWIDDKSDKITIHNHDYSKYIDIDNDFCKFVGLYTADGYSSKSGGTVKITSNSKETHIHSFVREQMEKLGNKPSSTRKYPNRNAVDIMLFSTLHRNVFLDWCKKHEHKQLPDWFRYLPLEKQKAMLVGLFMGDGCYWKKKNVSLYGTISKTLADQIKWILRRLRIGYNCHLRDRTKDDLRDGKNRQPIYKFEIYGDIQNGEFDTVRNNTRNVYVDNYHLLKIKNIEDSSYDEDTYNIEVENDNSYCSRLSLIKNCEGLGCPQLEAASCAVPIMAVDYSAMEDIVRDTRGIPLKVIRMFRELETGADRAYPDNDYCAEKIYEFFNKPRMIRQRMGMDARKAIEGRYNWDENARIWMEHFDKAELTGLQGKWDSPPQLHHIPNEVPPNLSIPDFVKWLLYEVIHEPERLYTYTGIQLIQQLTFGMRRNGIQTVPTNPNEVFQQFKNYAEKKNFFEQARCGQLKLTDEDYIQYARMKGEIYDKQA